MKNESLKENTSFFSKFIKTENEYILNVIKNCERNCSEKTNRRIKDILLSILKQEKEKLKSLLKEGLPDEAPILRSLIWKYNLRYFGKRTEDWVSSLNKKREEYFDIKNAFLIKLEAERKLFEDYASINSKFDEESKASSESTNCFEDDSILINVDEAFISENSQSNKVLFNKQQANSNLTIYLENQSSIKLEELSKYIKNTDKALLEMIDKDVRRTQPAINFFFMPTRKDVLIDPEQLKIKCDRKRAKQSTSIEDIYLHKDYSFESHHDVLSRILYIYAKLNIEINYVQGMNEILAPLYYCFAFNPFDDNDPGAVEADVFWCFTLLMEDLKNFFDKSKDSSQEGIFSLFKNFNECLKITDKDLHSHFIKKGIDSSQYAFRWILLLFSQEFVLPETIKLWDVILNEKNKILMTFYLSLAILKLKRQEVIKADFTEIIIALQKIDHFESFIIIETAEELKKIFGKKIEKFVFKV